MENFRRGFSYFLFKRYICTFINVMRYKELHTFFPFRNIMRLAILASLVFQIFIITYNHFNGFYVQQNFMDFMRSFAQGVIISIIVIFLIVYLDLIVIQYLNKAYRWKEKSTQRILLLLLYSAVFSILLSAVFSGISYIINSGEMAFVKLFRGNVQILFVINLITLAVLEAYIYYNEGQKAKLKAQMLEKELSEIKFEVLKSQLEPHFLFNSLNVLSGLIDTEPAKAQLFAEKLSQVYRYILETIDKPVVELGKELEFAKSYLFLQKIRYGEHLTYNITLPSEYIDWGLPPLSLQILLENSLKHNVVNHTNPLLIEIYNENSDIIVKNNFQPKTSYNRSSKVGQINLSKRYAMISKKKPKFSVENGYYIAKLPLIDIDNESSDS